MTTPPIERDQNGRFLKASEPDRPDLLDESGVHPVSKLLFGWVGSPRTPNVLLVLVIAISVGLVIVDTVIAREDYFAFAQANWFYSLWGFGAFAFAVLAGWPLGKLLRRDEDYYGEADTRPDDVDPEVKR